jgi:hypothetical protein
MKKVLVLLSFFLCLGCVTEKEEKAVPMVGIVLDVNDLGTVDWPRLAHENGINTIGTHIFPRQVMEFIQSDMGKVFLAECEKYGIAVEHQLHSMSELLPRELFKECPEMFRMNSNGERTDDSNCCVHSEEALDIIASKAVEFASVLKPTNHRYYFWLDDGKETCKCPKCREYSASEQALIIENRIIEALREVDPKAKLAHLAYANTLSAPKKVVPNEGIFLEFAPFYRRWDRPLADTSATSNNVLIGMTHGANLRYLEENLTVFSVEDAVVLEYWLDVSLHSSWRKPAVKLPWNKEVYESDIETYRQYGLKNFTSFGVYMDSEYFSNYPEIDFLKEYSSKQLN